MKKLSAPKCTHLNKRHTTESKANSAAETLMASAKSLKEAGNLLLTAVQSLPADNIPLASTANALINAHCSLIKAAQMLAEAGEMLADADKKLPSAAERLKTLEYTLN